MEKIYDYTIKLLRYVLNGDVPSLPEDVDFEKLYEFGRSHGVENMLYVALRDLKIDVPETILHKFYYSYLMSIKFDTLQTMELEKISNAFEEAEIDFIPLKGSVVKYFYPMPNYRRSGDIDVLVREKDMDRARTHLENAGYKMNYIFEEHSVHLRFVKEPFFCLELHKALVSKKDRSGGLLLKAWDYSKIKNDKKHTYEFDVNFLYVHLIAHIAKHLYAGGAGLRLFADIWIMQRDNMIDRGIVNCYLKEANLTEIENFIVMLINRWFAGAKNDIQVLDKLELFVFKGGSFGTIAQKLDMLDSDSIDDCEYRNKYWKKKFLKYVFEPRSYMKNKYPILVRHGWLLPIMWVYRLITIPFTEMNKVNTRINEYVVSKNSEKNDLSEIYKMVK